MRQTWKRPEKLSPWDLAYTVVMALACLISYRVSTYAMSLFVEERSELLGGMWAVVATVFVFRDTRVHSLSAGIGRLSATLVSFALCLAYLLIFPFTPAGMAALIGIGTLVMMLLGWRDDIITTGITTAVVMVVAGMSPLDAWHQPLLRLIETVIGIATGVAGTWIGSSVFFKLTGKPVR